MRAATISHPSPNSRCVIVGLMSGTSADGIDAVVAEISGRERGLTARVLAHTHHPFSGRLRARVLEAGLHGSVSEICELNFVLGERFAAAALAAIRQAKVKPAQITAIGSHGQTVHHLPRANTPSTLQIGEPAVIAERTGITTVADFRVRDMAAGGQGAPLVPFADWALFTDQVRPRIIQNIGGIGNLTFLPADAKLEQVFAFDTGPGNMVIDGVVSMLTRGKLGYDRNGRLAAKGKVSEALVRQMMRHPFMRRTPPKTTGREEFGEGFIRKFLDAARRAGLNREDMVATATAFTAESIADAYRRFVFSRIPRRQRAELQVVLGGGGARNPVLRRMLHQRASLAELLTHEDLGVSSQAKEALAFAILAHETIRGRPGNVPGATGARRPVVLGKIVPG